jgi:uncharacterized protein
MPEQEQRFHRVFKNRHVVLPVIHVCNENQAHRNACIAKEAAADGIFLINHSLGSDDLFRIHAQVVADFPGWWVGVNCLDLSPEMVFSRLTSLVSGVWVDNAMIQEGQTNQPDAEAVLKAQAVCGWQGLYFGGVAFKYQRPVNDLNAAARIASRYMDVVTTSGPGTGQAAHVEKIRTMKEALGDFPLAIASGITPDNASRYLPYSDCYLVATGISTNFYELDPLLVRRLLNTVKAYDQELA